MKKEKEDDFEDEYAGINIYGYDPEGYWDWWLYSPVIGPPLAPVYDIFTGEQIQ